MQYFGSRVAALAAAVIICSPGLSAASTRGVSDDNPLVTALAGASCTLGSSCTGVSLIGYGGYNGFVVAPDPEPHLEGTIIRPFSEARMFVYREGVVSFGEQLPLSARVALGTASLGDGNWFAPGFGSGLDVFVYSDGANNKYRINWGGPVKANAAFQLQLFNSGFGATKQPFLEYNGPDPAGRTIAANFTPYQLDQDPFFPPSELTGGDRFALLHVYGGFGIRGPDAPGAPEPAAWALMVLGFGAMGAVVRRRRTVAPAD